MTEEEKIQKALGTYLSMKWKESKKLFKEGDKSWKEAERLRREASELRNKSVELHEKGDKLFEEGCKLYRAAIKEVYGNGMVEINWDTGEFEISKL